MGVKGGGGKKAAFFCGLFGGWDFGLDCGGGGVEGLGGIGGGCLGRGFGMFFWGGRRDSYSGDEAREGKRKLGICIRGEFFVGFCSVLERVFGWGGGGGEGGRGGDRFRCLWRVVFEICLGGGFEMGLYGWWSWYGKAWFDICLEYGIVRFCVGAGGH